MSDGLSVEESEILALLRDGVLRRDLLDCEDSAAAKAKVTRFYKSQAKKPVEKKATSSSVAQSVVPAPTTSITETLLVEAEKGTPPQIQPMV